MIATRNNRAALLALLLASGAYLSPPAGAATPGWRRYEVPATGKYALAYVPAALDQSQPAPVVIFLHGSGSSPEAWRNLLEPIAEAQRFVLLLPRAHVALGWGVGPDATTIGESLSQLEAEILTDARRISIAGHSSGGAYAMVYAYSSRARLAGVFSLGAPYRTVLALADPDYVAPLRMYYGTTDPNYSGGSYEALAGQWQTLGVPVAEEIAAGFGHSSWPDSTLPDGFAFLLAQTYRTAGGCVPSDTRLCLRGGRFAIEATWRDFQGNTGPAQVSAARTGDSGLLWFFGPGNWELQVKVLDGCALNGRYWVFAAGTTNVEFTLTVSDLANGAQKIYTNPLGTTARTVADTGAFVICP